MLSSFIFCKINGDRKSQELHLRICIQLRMTKHPSRKVVNFRHLLGCDTIVKMNKMIHKKRSFLVIYVIYVSFVYTDSKKTASCSLSRHTIFATFGRQLKCLLVRIQGGLYLFHYVLDNLNWLLFVFCPI